jgi:nuclear pore complex protein Nup98-Nup96
VVRELLMAHVDDWGVDEEVVAFFTEQLRLPAAWLAEAQALWAQYSADEAGQLDHLLAAGDWPAAHALLCEVVAPRWLLAGGWRGWVRVEVARAVNGEGKQWSWQL